ncbi:MAG TPA: class I SAM-dependent methyltransferase [Tepidisphaeraceae bacterium]|nr:class I SAM-dependent methyltransferase [Tepidisphaeraceae bacterium]
MSDEWKDPEHALAYLRRADGIPHRAAGEETLLAEVPGDARRVLDLGCGDGRLLALVMLKCRHAEGVGVDFSPVMLARAGERFRDDSRVRVREHDLARPLPDWGKFDVVCSSFAIHHLPHERKRELYREVYDALNAMGVFCNLEEVFRWREARSPCVLQPLHKRSELLSAVTRAAWRKRSWRFLNSAARRAASASRSSSFSAE